MLRLPITQVKPGDRLAEPLRTDAGQVLLGEGVVLTQNKILMLRQRGVLLINIQSTEDVGGRSQAAPEPEPLDPEELKKIVVDESRRFGDTRQNPVMDALFRAIINRASVRTAE